MDIMKKTAWMERVGFIILTNNIHIFAVILVQTANMTHSQLAQIVHQWYKSTTGNVITDTNCMGFVFLQIVFIALYVSKIITSTNHRNYVSNNGFSMFTHERQKHRILLNVWKASIYIHILALNCGF